MRYLIYDKHDNRRSRIDGELPRVGITANGPQDQQITMVPKAIWNACALPAQSVIASAARKKTAGLRQGLLDQGLMPFAVLRRVMRTKTS